MHYKTSTAPAVPPRTAATLNARAPSGANEGEKGNLGQLVEIIYGYGTNGDAEGTECQTAKSFFS